MATPLHAKRLRNAEAWLSGTTSKAVKEAMLEAADDLDKAHSEIKCLRKLLKTAVGFVGAGEVEGTMERWLRRAEKKLEG